MPYTAERNQDTDNMAYEGQRQRSDKTVAVKQHIGLKQGFKLWLNQWRWSEIKKVWSTEYARTYYKTVNNLDTINRKLGR